MPHSSDEHDHSLRKMELNNLKFELNPHTFKNILQQIQSLSLSTNRAIENLMQILNYMLYDTDRETVTLQQEVEFMNAYKKMQQSVLPGFVDIIFEQNLSEDFLQRKGIAPMLTVAFLENAFKHADTDSRNCMIRISLRETGDNEMRYSIENSFRTEHAEGKKAGIGYRNLRRRLDLMYPGLYEISTETADCLHRAILTITLPDYES